MPTTYTWQNGLVTSSVTRSLDGFTRLTITFAAEAVRRERNRVHARVTVFVNGTNYGWTNCNVERVEDRSRLIKSVFDAFETPEEREAYRLEEMKADFHDFCRGLWEAWIARDQPEPLKGELCAPTFILTPFVLENSSTILFAPGGRGKSTLALLMAISIDAGLQTHWPVAQRKVLFVNLERSRESIRNRIALINRALGLPVERDLLTLNARGRPFDGLVEPLRQAIGKQAIGLVVVDSISRTGYGKLTDDDTANRVIDAGNALGVAMLWIGHTPRADESHLFGSTMFRNGADIEVRLHSQSRENVMGLGLEMTKANDVRPRPMQVLALEFDEAGLKGVRRSSIAEFPELDANRAPTIGELIEAYLLESKASSPVQIAKDLGLKPGSVRTLLARDKERFVPISRDGKTVYGLAARAA